MMHVPDLAPIGIPPFEASDKLIAVGWLELGHDYQRGEIEPAFVQKLTELLIDPWQPAIAIGRHSCGFCRLTGGPASFQSDRLGGSVGVQMGISNLWLPADGFLYVAPSLVLHYMDAHSYSPPAEFQAAVMSCPAMRSMDYLKAILKNGPKGIASRSG